MSLKPMIKYRGGKSKEIPAIMWRIPRFRGRYFEPFFGGGALFFHLEPREAVINDINPQLMQFYSGVRDNYYSLRRELDEIEHLYALNREEFNRLKAKHPNERVEDKNEELYYHLRAQYNGIEPKQYSNALLYYYINKTAYSGMIRYNSQGEFNVPFGRYGRLNTKSVSILHSNLLKRAEILNMDYSTVFDLTDTDDFMFLDPPYDCVFSDYGNSYYRDDGFNEREHRRLAQDFKNLSCKTLMVIGKTPLTEELYHGYIQEEYEKNYAVNIRNRFKSSATHIVVANYRREWNEPEPVPYENGVPEIAQLMAFEESKPYGKH